MIDYQEASRVAIMLDAVGEPTRMLIVEQLTAGPHYVGELSALLDIPMVNMSHHLGVMRSAGLVEDKKEGRRVLYSFHPDVIESENGKATLTTLKIGHLKLVINGRPTKFRSEAKPPVKQDTPKHSTTAAAQPANADKKGKTGKNKKST